MKRILFVISFCMPMAAAARVERIQSTRLDRSQVSRIYLAPGLGNIILFPCALLEVFVGRSEDLKAQISPNDKKILFLNLKLNTSLPTNLIAKCDSERGAFVFDVIPSQTKHQDVVEIKSAYGAPVMTGGHAVEASNTLKVRGRLVVKAPVLVEKGAAK